ncbi:MAG: GntR family transcriptional regulator, partial [Pseudomonadota bacterium]|nr:GntR family transcriptional regulator [Pseudomonadota bacterium]
MLTESRHSALKLLVLAARSRHSTASAAVTDALRQAIVSGVLPAGLPLRQDVLAADLGVSRTPIRESIRCLETEGLVDFAPHCGAVVATLQPDEILEIAQMRLALESVALERSFKIMTTADLDRAEQLLLQLDQADELGERNVLNRRFHAALYGLTPVMRLH